MTPEPILRDRNVLMAELREAGHTVISATKIKCAWHDDRTPSAGIFTSTSGDELYRCHVCKLTIDAIGVRARRKNQPRAEAYRDMTGQPDKPQPTPRIFPDLAALRAGVRNVNDVYRYHNPDTGRDDIVVIRTESAAGKSILQATPVIGGWVLKGLATGSTPLYHRAGIRQANTITLVEGEKCAKTLILLNIPATTWVGGVPGVSRADFSPLAGKHVIVWPDHDKLEPDGTRKGHVAMREAIRLMQMLNPPPSISWLDPEDIGLNATGEDVADYLDDCSPTDTIERRRAYELAITAARPIDPLADLVAYQEDAIAGRRRPVLFPLPYVHRLSRALVPETITLLCGEPGAGKSLLLLQGVARWAEQGIPTAVWMLEDQRYRHLSRVYAILSGNAAMTREEWMEANPVETRRIREEFRPIMEKVSPAVRATDDGDVTHAAVLAWLETEAKAGKRILAVDPVTACDVKGDPWTEDRRFLMGAKQVARKYGCSIILVTHPKLGGKAGSNGADVLDRIAGGAAYPRFAQTILWVAVEQEGQRVFTVKGDGGQFEYTNINRLIHIAKARNGYPGKIAARFESTDGRFLFEEKGVVIKVQNN